MKMLKLKRFIAIYIDFAFTTFIVLLLTDFFFSFSKDILMILIITLLDIFFIYTLFFRKDFLFKNASLGKKIMRIGIYDEHNQKVTDKKLLIKRNIASFEYLPLYPFMILFQNKSAGDEKFHTKVMENPKVKKQE